MYKRAENEDDHRTTDAQFGQNLIKRMALELTWLFYTNGYKTCLPVPLVNRTFSTTRIPPTYVSPSA